MPQKIGNDWVLTQKEIQDLDKLYSPYYNYAGNEDFDKAASRSYAIEDRVPDKPLLFISMNPSFSSGNVNNGLPVFYSVPGNKTNKFFRAINQFYNELLHYSNKNVPPLAHHDLVFIRETNQKNVENWMKNNSGFFAHQLSLSKVIIELSEPRLIVVLNAGARDEFKKLFGQNAPFDWSLGAYIYKINGKEIPVLFSGMLSGQRALDLGSRQSLLWHIDYICRTIRKK